jgi:hypothetical protein
LKETTSQEEGDDMEKTGLFEAARQNLLSTLSTGIRENDFFPFNGKEYSKKEVRYALENNTTLGKAIV